ncbi:hypothetical protein ACI2OX_05465 [Bacillus sp. N9]
MSVPSISIWHGFNGPLYMTIGVIAIERILFSILRHWQPIYRLLPPEWSLNALYSFALVQAEERSATITKSYMTGNLRDYALYVYLFFL